MRSRRSVGVRGFAALALAGAVAVVAASCSDGGTGAESMDASIDGNVLLPGEDGGAADGSDGALPGTSFRVAHVSPDLGPVDVCYRASPSEGFTGPLLASSVERDAAVDATDGTGDGGEGSDAGVLAVSFGEVTPYFAAPTSGSLEVAIVAASDRSCSTPRARQRLTLSSGGHTTIVLLGRFQADAGDAVALDLVAFVDDLATSTDSARSRFIHAALGTSKVPPWEAFTVSALDDGTTVPLAATVEPRHASTSSTTPPVVDPLGYHEGQPLASGAVRLERHDSGAPASDAGYDAGLPVWQTTPFALDLTAGTTHTGLVTHDYLGRLTLVWCSDTPTKPSCTIVRAP